VNVLVIFIIGRVTRMSPASSRGVPDSNPGEVIWKLLVSISPVLSVLITPNAPLIILSLTVYNIDPDIVVK
jgi:hypothetical protein